MHSLALLPDELLDPPPRLYERLRQIAGYVWDDTKLPFHSTYDFWHVSGTRYVSTQSNSSAPNISSPGSVTRLASGALSPSEHPATLDYAAPSATASASASTSTSTTQSQSQTQTQQTPQTPGRSSPPVSDSESIEQTVVARISYHGLREERAFHITKSLTTTADPEGDHIVKPIDLIHLAPIPGDRGVITVAIYHHPGHNYLWDVLDLGPAFYKARRHGDVYTPFQNPNFRLKPPIGLHHFLDFAIGASQCLEILHHSQGIVHGEIRGDAFHYNKEENKVRIGSFGSGTRSFEHGLTSTGWSTLSKELGAKTKLLYISPEQTGRMPVEPDSRTDIYSLGVLFWMLLTQSPVFDGDSPLDIVQGVLGRRIPNVSEVRIDIPDVVGRIIQKCTAKNVADRYHSATGLRHDLTQVQELLCDGNWDALNEWKIGSKDVSSFFMLPTAMIGRSKEKADLLKVIDRVAKSHSSVNRKQGMGRFSDGSTISTEIANLDDLSSDGGGSTTSTNRRSGSFTHTAGSDPSRQQQQTSLATQQSVASDAHTMSEETVSSSQSIAPNRIPRPWERHQSISLEARSAVDSLGTDGNRQSMGDSSAGSSLSRKLGSAKFRRRGLCEVVTIEGSGGLGKSCLVQSILTETRRRGYCATAKFDTSRRTAFGPLLKLLSSLFKQVWGERNTETPFHQGLNQYIRPVWPMLHKVLGLPEFLLGPSDSSAHLPRSISSSAGSVSRNNGSRHTGKQRRGSSPSSSPGPMARNNSIASQTSSDFLRAGASTKTMRLMNTFLDVLRVFTSHKFICFCLDDLHFADEESLELISQIIAARMKMVIIITYRPEELSSERLYTKILNPPESDEYHTSGPKVSRITLSPLNEDDIVHYVSTCLSRRREEILPLALVLQSKTAGNPFYMREMLSACHRKKCIWYDYRDSTWHYDLDRLFEQFQGEKDYDTLDTGFITSRLDELPPAARSMLAWAAMLGSTFSFELVCRLMSGDYDYDDEDEDGQCSNSRSRKFYNQHEAIGGLQAAIQAYIVVSSENDDRFRFAHDRYVHAAEDLKECSSKRMHFIIAQTLLNFDGDDLRLRDSTASHICEASDLIKRRIKTRREYRRLLAEYAQASTENGARPTAAKYYNTAVKLLQDDPWTEGEEDVYYNETIQLYLRSAECHLFMGQHQPAHDLLTIIFHNAKTAVDKAPAFVLQSRIFSQNGNAQAAVTSLKECLGALGVELDADPTYQKCDERFNKLVAQIQSMDRSALLDVDQTSDPAMASIGAVLSETASAAWWSDCVGYYNLAMVMLEFHLSKGAFPQSGMAFLHMSVVALSRFGMIEFAVELGSVAQDLLYQSRDSFSIARGLMLYPCLVGHVHNSMSSSLMQMEDAAEIVSATGDRMSTILSYGLYALVRLFSSENLAELETICHYGCEEIPNWYYDTRGGVLLLGVRQVARALQGKTRNKEPADVLSDENHQAATYKSWLAARTQHSNRSTLLYESLELIPLFLYGHYDRAVEIGKRCLEDLPMLWALRNSRLILLFYGLSLAGQWLRKMQDPRSSFGDYAPQCEQVLSNLKKFKKMIEDWGAVSDVNYLCWYKLLEAQIAELAKDYGEVIQHYEEALDHAAEHDFTFEEALGNYLMAGFFLRRRARRSARSALLDALGLYRQVAAMGVATAIEEEHSLLLHGPTRNHRTAEAAVQTDLVADSTPAHYRAVDGVVGEEMAQAQENTLTEIKGERVGAWRSSMNLQAEAGAGLPALDMIDLHAILVSSQVISSVLNIDVLLKTMCDVILQTCGGSATLAAIVVQEHDNDDEWCVAASGDSERGASAHRPGLPLAGTALIAENVVLYCTRFLESVFIPDLLGDERFGNVSDSWLQKNPMGRSIIAMPIKHGNEALHGVLYLEGEAGSFTDRNVSVLTLLVMQLGISYSNAVAMKNVEKISAENRSMVTVQKQALTKALEAETKAKDAEAEAKRNVKLAEEAAKAKSIFLANVSHELRTPLNGVIGNSELLRDSSLNRDQLEMADSIRVSADLLLTVINDILDFSKMEADKMKLYIIAFNPEEMVREVVRAVSYSNREKTSKKNVKIIQDIKLPPMLIYGDPIRLHQVLGNLIGNSLKFTEDGSITIGARLDSDTKEKATLTFWVRDTGIGIPPQQLAKLFQPFSQADASTARKYGGSGLGLSICKSLIEIMMEGTIQLESEENEGTTAWFTVSFDKAKPDVSAGEAQSKTPPPWENAQTANNSSKSERPVSPDRFLDLSHMSKDDVRICVAEDNPINQKIAIQYVQRLGYTNVSAFENGLKAVEGLRQKAKEGDPFHIVLMDVQMPVLDGYEATKLIRKDPIETVRKTLVIAMTASAIQGDREKCLAAGMNDYLAKPVRSEVLKKKLDAYLNAQPVDTPRPPVNASAPVLEESGTNSNQTSDASTPKPQSPKPQSPKLTVSDPMRDGAIFNQPVDQSNLQSMEGPMLERLPSGTSTATLTPGTGRDGPIRNTSSSSLLALSRTSSDSRVSNVDSGTDGSAQQQKRLPRKLTKSRGNSDTNVEKRDADKSKPRGHSDSLSDKFSAEKLVDRTKGVLTKKGPQPKTTTTAIEDGNGGNENTTGELNDGNGSTKNSSVPQQSSSSLRDRIFPS